MAENNEEKLIAAALQIAKSIGQNDARKEDILKIFGGRLRETLADEDPRGGSIGLAQTLNFLDHQISRYLSSDRSIWSSPADSAGFLDAIDQLIGVIREWTPLADDKSILSSLDRAGHLLQQSMFRLEDEFRAIVDHGSRSIESNRRRADYVSSEEDENEDDDGIPVAQPVKDYNIVIDLLPAGSIRDLNEIAKRMVVAEYGKECSRAYVACRMEFLEESLARLGLQRLSVDEFQKMQWAQLENEIEIWVKAINVALRILFPSERRLCDRVFFGFTSTADVSFIEICKDSTIHLLNFVDAVAIGSRAPDRLFKVLDVYETVRDLMSEFELMFPDKYGLSFWNKYVTIWKRLGELIREIFVELENLVRGDPAKTAFPGGGLHPITRYVMNYLLAASRSRKTLEHVFDESDGHVDHRRGDNNKDLSSSQLAVQVAWIMKLLVNNLEAKSKLYRDSALSSLFMMNNGSYILQKVKDNELGTLLGDDWVRKNTAKVRQCLVNYQRNSWGKVLDLLKVDNSSQSPDEASKNMKEKLKLFNSWFEEICRSQSSWVFYDDILREELRVSVSEPLSRAYRNFIGRFQSVSDSGMQPERLIRFREEDIENQINGLFQKNDNGRR